MIIALGYETGVGKDKVADILVQHHGFKRISFADIPKQICQLVFNVDFSQKDVVVEKYESTPRQLLIRLAESLKKEFGQDLWAKCIPITKHEKIVISDLRFKEEAKYLKELNAVFVRVQRNHVNKLNVDELKDFDWDFTIYNNDSIETLKTIVDGFIGDFY